MLRQPLGVSPNTGKLLGDIEDALNHPCPFWPGKRVRDTHFLTWIPNGADLDQLNKLAQDKRQGSIFMGLDVDISSLFPPRRPYWLLMTRSILPPGTAMDNEYRLPDVLEATTAMLARHTQAAWSPPRDLDQSDDELKNILDKLSQFLEDHTTTMETFADCVKNTLWPTICRHTQLELEDSSHMLYPPSDEDIFLSGTRCRNGENDLCVHRTGYAAHLINPLYLISKVNEGQRVPFVVCKKLS